MIRSLWISKTGMEAQQTALDAVSTNLANTATNGYKRGHAAFEDLMYQNLRQVGAAADEQNTLPTGLQLGLGVRTVATSRQFTQGSLQQSGNALDVAINGQGFFQVQMPDGTTGYTRDGAFQVSSTGQLVTNNGQQVLPGVTIPANAQSVTVGADGRPAVRMVLMKGHGPDGFVFYTNGELDLNDEQKQALLDFVRRDGKGFVAYQWPKPGSDKPVEKISYVQGFEPWGWVIGSGTAAPKLVSRKSKSQPSLACRMCLPKIQP